MDKIKKCPSCGTPGKLIRLLSDCKKGPVTIKDQWTVYCPNGCFEVGNFYSEIFQDDSGEIIVKHNGAKEAIEEWNKMCIL